MKGSGTGREVLRVRLFENRRRERPELFAKLDLRVDDLPHVRAAGIRQDAAIAERPRAPLHPALKPADHLPVGDPLRCPVGTARLRRR